MKNSGKSFSKALLVSFIALAVPQILGRYGSQILLYFICYSISALSLVVYYFKHKTMFSKIRTTILVAYATILILPLLINTFIGINTIDNDYFDTIVKILSAILFFVLVPKQIHIEDYKTLFSGITIFVVIACLFNVAINFGDMLTVSNLESSYMVNFSSFFANRNTFAMYLFVGIFSASLLLKTVPSKKKVLIPILLLEIITLFFTMSRGGLLATGILLFPSLAKMKRKTKILLSLAILASFILLSVNPTMSNTLSRLLVRSDVGTSGRNDLWEAGIEYAHNTNIITGTGYYTALNVIGVSQLHSMFVDTLVDTGILGLFAKVFFFFYAYLCIKRSNTSLIIKKIYSRAFLSTLFLSFFESVNIFALGSTEMLYTIFFITVPLSLSSGEAHDQ